MIRYDKNFYNSLQNYCSFTGLFHKAVMQSGSLFCPWGFKKNSSERCFKLASRFGITSTDPNEIVESMRKLSDKEIAKVQASLLTEQVKCFSFLSVMAIG